MDKGLIAVTLLGIAALCGLGYCVYALTHENFDGLDEYDRDTSHRQYVIWEGYNISTSVGWIDKTIYFRKGNATAVVVEMHVGAAPVARLGIEHNMSRDLDVKSLFIDKFAAHGSNIGLYNIAPDLVCGFPGYRIHYKDGNVESYAFICRPKAYSFMLMEAPIPDTFDYISIKPV